MAILDAIIALLFGLAAFICYYVEDPGYWIYLLGAGYFIAQAIWRQYNAKTE